MREKMSAGNQEHIIKLEQIKKDWQDRRLFYKAELAKIDDISKRFALQQEILKCDQGIQETTQEIESLKKDNKSINNQLDKQSSTLAMSENSESKPNIGIITALPQEYAAVRKILENTKNKSFPGQGGGNRYLLGDVSTKDKGKHTVALCLAAMGNNIAAIRASVLLKHFPDLESIIMVGIAGGIPDPGIPDEHVRLGDIVISNEKGVIQYDFDKETITENTHRHPPRPPSSSLLEAVRLLEVEELMGEKPWLKFIEQALLPKGQQRPSVETDILVSSTNPDQRLEHPQDFKRNNGEPRVFIAPIASANQLLQNPIKRDQLRNKFGVKAVEMESSGIADATWNYEIGYLVVRGICDYCDSQKNDGWHPYAAAVAAAYTRALLESMPDPKL
ncbi:MAG: 5'-methylthioadenosine/S-adenosylhomocysteine nucleosidase [Symploca sp. SIO2G7]|nr:5'-methylthioadenosine/S-adenosylhomocysteine nucleosidase [Symploca sp. SIO2G7]